jgi:hypothetical protein
MGWLDKTSAMIGKAFGNPNTRKESERGLRGVMRASIAKVNRNALKFSGYENKPRMEGLTYIRTRKSRPNVPDKVRGLSKLQHKDTRIVGKFTGQAGLPSRIQEKLNTKPMSAHTPMPFTRIKTPVTHPARLFKGVLRG